MAATRGLLLTLVVAVAAAAWAAPAHVLAAKPPDEVKMGKEAADELEKQYKLVKDDATNARVQKIGAAIAKVAMETEVPASYGTPTLAKFAYSFKVLDDKDVNALSMPGGFVYINKGLLDYVQSDDELAGVIAHEVAHVAHHHMVQLVKEQAKLNNQLAITLLASILAGAGSENMGNVMMGARFVQIAKLNGYSREAEEDADLTGLTYLGKANYNPVGMLTFMERLARDELARPEVQWGVYQTHPNPGDRARTLLAKLQAQGVKVDRRATTKAAVAEVKKVEGKDGLFEVLLGGSHFFTPAASDQPSEQRAKEITGKLNALLNGGLKLREVKLTTEPAGMSARGEVILSVTDADVALAAPKTAAQIAQEAHAVLYRVLFDQGMETIY